MKNFSLIFLILNCSYFTLISQPCLPEGITFTTQTQIDSFQINYPDCTEIEGDVEIGSWSWGNTEISNLDSLNVLTFIGGNLWIHHNSALTNLTGLNNIASIGGDLEISFNPGLTSINGLENLTSIDGELRIGVLYYYSQGGNSSLTNMVGLENLTTIGGGLEITDNDALVNLTGLNNLNNIGADLVIRRNDSINHLTGLENLISIGGNLNIGQDWSNGNYSLLNLSGLDNLASIGGSLEIIRNPALTSLTGLENLSTIGGSLIIGSLYPNSTGNPSLTNIISLENVTSVGGVIYVNCNNVLISLNGLDNIDALSISNLFITNNSSLFTCEVQSICGYLASPGASISIHNNAPGCNSPEEVQEACAQTYCLPEGITFTTQEEIDNFQINYPDCSIIEGDVVINGDDITNLYGLNELSSIWGILDISDNDALTSLSGLENLSSIGGDLQICDNDALINLSGLDNLSFIGQYLRITENDELVNLTGLEGLATIEGVLEIGVLYGGNLSLVNLTGLEGLSSVGGVKISYNPVLTSFAGLNNLTSIDGFLRIGTNSALISLTGLDSLISIEGDLGIGGNNALTSLGGLDNLTSIGGDLSIWWHDALTSLSGLDNINAGSINKLSIANNPSLSSCEVQSVCDYLASPNGEIEIFYNANGCNSQAQVLEACETTNIEEFNSKENLTSYPNPCFGSVNIRLKIEEQSHVVLKIFEISGREIMELLNEVKIPGTYKIMTDLRDLPKGLYFIQLRTNYEFETLKIIKTN